MKLANRLESDLCEIGLPRHRLESNFAHASRSDYGRVITDPPSSPQPRDYGVARREQRAEGRVTVRPAHAHAHAHAHARDRDRDSFGNKRPTPNVQCPIELAHYVFRASSIRSTLSLPEPTKVKRIVIWLALVNRSSRSLTWPASGVGMLVMSSM